MKTELERTNDCIIRLFHQYAILDPKDDFLQPKEFEKLMKEQLSQFLKDTLPRGLTEDAYIKQLFEKAVKDHSEHLDFPEFMTVFESVLKDTHNKSHHLGKEERGHDHHPPGHRLGF